MNKTATPSNENGFTLIEVLVAIMILALGAGGVAAMQLHALRLAQQSAYQSQATQLAVELAESMQANPAGAAKGAYLFAYQAAAGEVAATSAPAGCFLRRCDSAAMAQADVRQWQERLRQSLPLARAVVCRDANPAAADSWRWRCDHASSAPVVVKIGWAAKESPANNAEPPPAVVVVVPTADS